MTSKTLRAAVLGALAMGGVGSAYAFDITAYTPATAVNVYIGGSTAQDTSLLAAVTDAGFGICSGGDVYQMDNGTNFAKPTQRMYLCTSNANAGTGITVGTQIAVFKEDAVGSANGVAPLISVAKGAVPQIRFIDATSGNPATQITDADCTTGTNTVLGLPAGWTVHTTCNAARITALGAVNPNAGLADVDATVLRVPNTGAKFTASDVALLKAQTGYHIVWGVPVTKNLYYALQAAEGLAAGCPAGNLDDKACAPSLSKQQITSLYTGNVITWNQILGLNNATDNNVYVCKRDIGSGTEAAFEQYFTGIRCGGADQSFAPQDSSFVFTSGSGGGVETCLNAIANNNTLATKLSIAGFNELGYTAAAFTPAGGGWAIGVLSTEINMTSAPTEYAANNDAFRFVEVGGVFPDLSNVVNGFDDFFGATACYTIGTGHTGAPTASQATVFGSVCKALGANAAVVAANVKFRGQPQNFDGGDLAPPELQNPLGRPAASIPATDGATGNDRTSAINAWFKAPNGSVNNCDEPTLYNAAAFSETTPAETNLNGTGNVNK